MHNLSLDATIVPLGDKESLSCLAFLAKVISASAGMFKTSPNWPWAANDVSSINIPKLASSCDLDIQHIF